MSGWVVLHEPDADPDRNWADLEFDDRTDADDLKGALDDVCPACLHLVVWVD